MIAFYVDSQKKYWYVAQVKGDGGKDWGYTLDYSKAIRLSRYWQKRFQADCQYMGRKASFV